MRGLAALFGLVFVAFGGAAQAQELSFKFTNPSFGGNPFYSDHLLGVATAQRPERETDESGLTEGEQFARQIQSRILSALSASIVEAITGSDPGTSGEFTVGDQTIFFERTLTEIRLTITDNVTGEVTVIVVPVFDFDDSNPFGAPSGYGGGGAPPQGSPLNPQPVGAQPGGLLGGPLDSGSLFDREPLDGGLGVIP